MLQTKYLNEVWELVNSPTFSLSFSSICALIDSPLEFYKYLARKFYTDEEKAIYDKDTDAVKMGRAIDEYIFKRLHPLGDGDWNFFCEPERCNGATAAGKAQRKVWIEWADGKELLKFDEWIDIQNMYDSICAHNFASELLIDSALAVQEKISFRTKDGILVNGILDVRGFNSHPDMGRYITDLKKMPQANRRYVSYQVMDRLLHVQGYIYTHCFEVQGKPIDSYFLVVVTESGALNVLKMQPKHLEMGKELFEFAMNRFVYDILLPQKKEGLLQSYPPKQGFTYLI